MQFPPKHKPVYKKVAFSYQQFAQARVSEKFFLEDDHRKFVEWLFEKQHQYEVLDHTKLVYDYSKKGFVSITGMVGVAVGKK